MVFSWTLIFVIAIVVTAIWAFVVWWQRKKYTRERFAFAGFTALCGLAMILTFSVTYNTSLFHLVISELLKPLGFDITPKPLSPFFMIIITAIIAFLCLIYVLIFRYWDGQKSIAQYEQEQNQDQHRLFQAMGLFLRRDEKLAVWHDDAKHQTVFEQAPSKAWHQRALVAYW